mgnify:CR=1 FL=1
MLTEGAGGHGGDAVLVALVAEDARLGRAVAVHEDVGQRAGDGDVLVVLAGLHVDDEAGRGVLGHGVDGLGDRLEVAAPVLGDHLVGLLRAGLQETPLVGGHPRRELAGLGLVVALVFDVFDRADDVRGEQPVVGGGPVLISENSLRDGVGVHRAVLDLVELALRRRGCFVELPERRGQELPLAGELVGELRREEVAVHLGGHVGDALELDGQKRAPAALVLGGVGAVLWHAQQPALDGVGLARHVVDSVEKRAQLPMLGGGGGGGLPGDGVFGVINGRGLLGVAAGRIGVGGGVRGGASVTGRHTQLPMLAAGLFGAGLVQRHTQPPMLAAVHLGVGVVQRHAQLPMLAAVHLGVGVVQRHTQPPMLAAVHLGGGVV